MRGRRVVPVAVAALAAALLGAGAASAMSEGTPTPDRADAPWMATFALRGDAPLPQRASCGGALVAPEEVLTAAHCLDGADPADVEVHIGAATLSADPGEVRGISAVHIAPGYEIVPSPQAPDDPEAASARDDLAAVRLKAPVTGVPLLTPVDAPPRPGDTATLYGHGITGPATGVSDPLRRGTLTVRADAACAAQTPAVYDGRSVLCAQDLSGARQPVQACFGDSGGPLVVRDADGDQRLAGVFSFAMETAGKPCGTPGFNAFADISTVRG